MSFIRNAVANLVTEEVKQGFRWSFSQWENYDGCPARWKFKSVMKLPTQPPGPAAARGLDMHDRVEHYIGGNISEERLLYGDPTMRFGDKKPAVIAKKYLPVLNAFRDHPNGERFCEKKVGYDPEWTQGGWRTGLPKGQGGVTMIWDAYRALPDPEYGTVVKIGEWKSGNPKDTHKDQRHLYGLGALLYHAGAAGRVEVTTYYLEDTGEDKRLVVTPADIPKMKEKWNQRVLMMQQDKICAPKPAMHCRWCDFAKAKGGPCQF